MKKSKKYPPIKPQFIKNGKNKVRVLLPINVYESIFEEIAELETKIQKLKKRKST